jgi:hypothetical protein
MLECELAQIFKTTYKFLIEYDYMKLALISHHLHTNIAGPDTLC